MSHSDTKTARFAVVVEACGRPEVYDLWVAPQNDKRFMDAAKRNRVMTIRPETGRAKKDYGMVGFIQEKNASYFIFPKPLGRFKDRRIIGIKYELVETPGPVGRVVRARSKPKMDFDRRFRSPQALANSGPSKGTGARAKRFKVTFRFIAMKDVSEEVEADSRRAAKEVATSQIRTPDLAGATVTRRIVRVSEADG